MDTMADAFVLALMQFNYCEGLKNLFLLFYHEKEFYLEADSRLQFSILVLRYLAYPMKKNLKTVHFCRLPMMAGTRYYICNAVTLPNMMAAYRLRSPGSIYGRSLPTLSDIISVYAKEEYRNTDARRRCFHSSPTDNIPSLLSRNINLWRRNDNVNKLFIRQISSTDGMRRKVLKSGRAHRKMRLKQATHKKSASKPENSKPTDPLEETLAKSKADDYHQETIPNSPKDDLFGVPMGNPLRERYIRSQQKINYPKTWDGWKEIFRKTKDTYLMSFEGFLLPKKKRDEQGNIIPDDEVKADEEDDADEKTTMKEKATDAANQIAGNVQKNISTIQQEAPNLVEMGQKVTGISSREELRAWVSEQLKLGTACLTEFMKGYRSGRDDEVDKMLHEYFKDLDEEKNDTTTTNNAVDESENNDTDIRSTKTKQRRLWGRKDRRRAKAMSSKIDAPSLGVNE